MDRKLPDPATLPLPPSAEEPPGSLPPGSAQEISRGFPPSPGFLDRALVVVTHLRKHCGWDRRQTAASLIPYLLEEAHETAEAIRSGNATQVRDELGDLLLNIAFQVIVAEEAGQFSREEVICSLEEKMIRRHPHLFGLGEPEAWDSIKARERETRGQLADPDTDAMAPDDAHAEGSVLDSIPTGSEPLSEAHALQDQASMVGFDWEEASGALQKTREEVQEVAEAIESGSHADLHEEIGDLLFSVVNLARLSRCHAPSALASANRKFGRRFRAVERLAAAHGLSMPGTSLEQLDALWEEVKRKERRDERRASTED